MTDHDSVLARRRIVAEQTRLIYGLSPMVAIAGLLVAYGFAYALLGHVDSTTLTYWLVVMTAIAVVRAAVFSLFFKKNPGDEVIHVWMWLNISLLFALGTTWGIGFVILFPEDSVHHQTILYFCVAGMTAGSLGAFSPRREAVWAFIFPALLFPAVFLLTKGDHNFTLMGFIVVLYLFVLFYSSIQLHNAYENFLKTSEALRAEMAGREKAQIELKESKERAEEATKLKDEFVSIVSHDLKNPVASISGLLKVLREDIDVAPDSQAEKIFKAISESCDNFFDMIDKLLDISRFHTGDISINLVRVDAKRACQIAIGQVGHLAKEKGVEISSDTPDDFWIYADESLVNSVLGNLVSNAIKFTNKGDHIVIYSPPNMPGSIAVKDTGVGIDPGIIDDLFKHEIKTSRMGTAGEFGTGLGLPFCHDIMMAHGGSLTVESTVGEGSVFIATFAKKPDGT